MIDSGIWSSDEELAPNSDTECEPLGKRRKHIEQIAQYCRDGGELCLLSVALRGPITRNPWARRKPAEMVKKLEVAEEVQRVRKRKRTTALTNKPGGSGRSGRPGKTHPGLPDLPGQTRLYLSRLLISAQLTTFHHAPM